MSLLKSLGKGLKRVVKGVGKAVKAVAPVAAGLLPGPLGIVASGIASIGGGQRPQALPGGAAMDLVSMAMPAGYMANPPVVAQARLPIPRVPTPAVPRTGGGVIRQPPSVGGRVRDAAGRILKQTPVGWLPRVGRAAASAAGWIAIGAYYLDAAGNVVGVRTTRRMNPLNHRALRRAISRVKGATKICREVERITAPRRRGRSGGGRGSARAEAACR